MIARVARRYDLSPKRLAGDTAYGTGRLLRWLTDRDITPHIPVWDKSRQTNGRFTRDDFSYDKERNVYICPGGKLLTSTGNIDQGRILYYRALKSDCSACPLKPQCTTGKERRIKRWEHEAVIDAMQERLDRTPHAMRIRRATVEHPFGTLKAWMGATHFKTRTLDKVRTEMSLHVLAYNLKRVIAMLGPRSLIEAIRA